MEEQSFWGVDGIEEDEEELEDTEVENAGKVLPSAKPGNFLTKRGITLRVLLKDGLIEPGLGVLSIHYLGRKFLGDLLADGKIIWQESGQAFNSPSAWATHCKRLVNPAKKSGCGWASVRYKGQKLDQYKTAWLRQNQIHGSVTEGIPLSEGEEDDLEEEELDCRFGKIVNLEPASSNKQVQRCNQFDIRTPVRFSTLGSRDSTRDPHTLVQLTSFMAINKFQPFHVSICSNALLLLDFHSHLTQSEVVGYLGGQWDTNSQLLTVLRAFPCRSRLRDTETAAAVEEEICHSLYLHGLSLVGWYHSHPFSPALPSLQDIEAQMDYQLKLQGSDNSFQPCLGLICGPYFHRNQGVQSTISPFWVIPPAEHRPNDYGMPMEVEVTYIQDNFLTSDILHDMILLVEFFKGGPDQILFQDLWNEEKTFLDKIKGSLGSRTPKEPGYETVLDQIYSLLSQLG
ncbi:PREDICTED: MPN domain-containing protein [Nanorana parkeri]|uniref:MPN domain-containing protein n=1 Tax=Nanorana parkeri TaxID=125878 RepID=UPI000854F0A4|nr:PREDICTED: MPN domain-containing protein [Nanorana parkeri]